MNVTLINSLLKYYEEDAQLIREIEDLKVEQVNLYENTYKTMTSNLDPLVNFFYYVIGTAVIFVRISGKDHTYVSIRLKSYLKILDQLKKGLDLYDFFDKLKISSIKDLREFSRHMDYYPLSESVAYGLAYASTYHGSTRHDINTPVPLPSTKQEYLQAITAFKEYLKVNKNLAMQVGTYWNNNYNLGQELDKHYAEAIK